MRSPRRVRAETLHLLSIMRTNQEQNFRECSRLRIPPPGAAPLTPAAVSSGSPSSASSDRGCTAGTPCRAPAQEARTVAKTVARDVVVAHPSTTNFGSSGGHFGRRLVDQRLGPPGALPVKPGGAIALGQRPLGEL